MIIQVTNHNHEWYGSLLITYEERDWGVLAYCPIPLQGPAYLRIKHGDYEEVGQERVGIVDDTGD